MTNCPYCKCKDRWYISTSGKESVYQCKECSKYFKVKLAVPSETAMNNQQVVNLNTVR